MALLTVGSAAPDFKGMNLLGGEFVCSMRSRAPKES